MRWKCQRSWNLERHANQFITDGRNSRLDVFNRVHCHSGNGKEDQGKASLLPICWLVNMGSRDMDFYALATHDYRVHLPYLYDALLIHW